MKFKDCDDAEFLHTFMRILETDQSKNNTYKLALARFLLEYSHAGGNQSVKYASIAPYFLRYYWSQECKSKLRQGPPHQTPKVISIIRDEFEKSNYPDSFDDIRRKFPDRIARCEEEITKHCFRDVIHRFQKLGNDENKIFYEYFAVKYDKSGNARLDKHGGILLNPHAISFFKRYYEPLWYTVILSWVRFLEERNQGTPRLTGKVIGLSGRRNQGSFKKYLEPFVTECFYCRTSLNDAKVHVDHVLPYDYIGETELWNLVLACQKCNCRKLGNLPPGEFIDNLVERNLMYRSLIRKLDTSLYVLGEDHGGGVWQHYNTAKQHKFCILEDFP